MTPVLNLGLVQLFWLPYMLLGLVAFCMVTSPTYLLNDLLDIEADRAHTTKRARPFAAGTLSIPTGCKAIAALGIIGLVLAFVLNVTFGMSLIVYAVLSLLYSFTLFIYAETGRGSGHDHTQLSVLLACGGRWPVVQYAQFSLVHGGDRIFLSLFLALGKRAIELNRARQRAVAPQGRGYRLEDLDMVKTAGLSASFVMVVIVLIYALLSQSTVISRDVSAVLLATLFLFWQIRFWLLVGRDEVHDDPIIFALKDRTSTTVLCGVLLVVVFEQMMPRVV